MYATARRRSSVDGGCATNVDGLPPGDLQNFRVAQDVRHVQRRQAGLARAEELAGTAQLQIHLGDVEAVARFHQRADALARRRRSSSRSPGCNSSAPRRGRRAREADAAARDRSARPARSPSPWRSARRRRLRSPWSRPESWISPALESLHRRFLFVRRQLARAAGRRAGRETRSRERCSCIFCAAFMACVSDSSITG